MKIIRFVIFTLLFCRDVFFVVMMTLICHQLARWWIGLDKIAALSQKSGGRYGLKPHPREVLMVVRVATLSSRSTEGGTGFVALVVGGFIAVRVVASSRGDGQQWFKLSLIGSYLDNYKCTFYLVLSSLVMIILAHISIIFDNFELAGFVLKSSCSNFFGKF